MILTTDHDDHDRHPVRHHLGRVAELTGGLLWCGSPRSSALPYPSFWVATLVLIVPAAVVGIRPADRRSVISFTDDPIGNLQQFVPAAAVLALGSAAGVMRLTRSSLLEMMRQDYMRTARAKGLTERSRRHSGTGSRTRIIPVVTVLGLQISGLLGGAIIVEQIFTLPGLGQYTFHALFAEGLRRRADDDAVRGRDGRGAEPARRCQLRVARPAHPVFVGARRV